MQEQSTGEYVEGDLKIEKQLPKLYSLLGREVPHTDSVSNIISEILHAHTSRERRGIKKEYKKFYTDYFAHKLTSDLNPTSSVNQMFALVADDLEKKSEADLERIDQMIQGEPSDEWQKTKAIFDIQHEPNYYENIVADFEVEFRKKFFPSSPYEAGIRPELFELRIVEIENAISNLMCLVLQQKPDILIFLDKSARPYSWLFRELWGKVSTTEMPLIYYLNVGTESRHLNDVAKIPNLDNKTILVVDDLSISGGSLVMAEDFINQSAESATVQTTSFFETSTDIPPLGYYQSDSIDPGIGVYDPDDFGDYNLRFNNQGRYYLVENTLSAVAPAQVEKRSLNLDTDEKKVFKSVLDKKRVESNLLRADFKKLAKIISARVKGKIDKQGEFRHPAEYEETRREYYNSH